MSYPGGPPRRNYGVAGGGASSPPSAPPPPAPPPPAYTPPPSSGWTPPPAGGWQPAPPPGGWQPAPSYVGPGGPQNDTLAVLALIFGIVGLVLGLLFGIAALVLGILGRRSIRESGGAKKGSGMALAGIILGVVSIVFSVVFVIALIANSSSSGVNYNTLQTGNCFNRTSGSSEKKVNCSSSHQIEVTGSFEVAAGPYPGEAGFRPQAEAQCSSLATQYLAGHSPAGLEIVWLVPQKGTWNSGVRTIVCGLQNADGTKRVGSLAG